MAYYVFPFLKDSYSEYFKSLREIRERESVSRDEKARKMMEELKKQRIAENKPSPRDPVLVSRRMTHLPPAADYLRQTKTDV